jgi:predicted phage-related endonuclease
MTKTVETPAIIPPLAVDELAGIKAQIAALQEREKALVDALKATGMERIIGTLHEAVVSLSERETIDTKKLRADLGDEIIAGYIRKTDVCTLKITARKVH